MRTQNTAANSYVAGGRTSRLNEDIEALRAVAVAFVIVAHLPSELVRWPGPAHRLLAPLTFWGGVDLFFAISGYVITATLLRQERAGRFRDFALPFYVRRIFRIWPAALAWLAIGLLAAYFFNRSGAFGQPAQVARDSVAAMLQVANIYIAHCHCGKEYVYWSLSLEEQFYLLFPLLLYLLGRDRLLPCMFALIAGQFWLARPVDSTMWLVRTDAIAFGVLVALMQARGGTRSIEIALARRRHAATALMLALLAAIALASRLPSYRIQCGLLAVLSGATVLVASGDARFLTSSPYLRRALLWGGSRSYSLYLVHNPCYWATREIFHRIAGPHTGHIELAAPFLVTALALIVLTSEASYRLIELPLRSLGRRLAKRIESPLPRAVDSAPHTAGRLA